eukprot:COSAG04_NODE_2160_length_4654_cov_1.775631_2_plen_49_part_00
MAARWGWKTSEEVNQDPVLGHAFHEYLMRTLSDEEREEILRQTAGDRQ